MSYARSAIVYDLIYASIDKDYEAESQRVHTLIQQHKRSDGNRLLDVACGTALHLYSLQQHYNASGLDTEPEMIGIARRRCPNLLFYVADMKTFLLDERFDAITCLFSAIGYMKTREMLDAAIATMARHLKPGGVLIIEPWVHREDFHHGQFGANFIDHPNVKVARLYRSRIEDTISHIHFHYSISSAEGIEAFDEYHELGLYTRDEYKAAFTAAGLSVEYTTGGTSGRGLYVGTKGL